MCSEGSCLGISVEWKRKTKLWNVVWGGVVMGSYVSSMVVDNLSNVGRCGGLRTSSYYKKGIVGKPRCGMQSSVEGLCQVGVGAREEVEPCGEGLWVPSLVVNDAIGAELVE